MEKKALYVNPNTRIVYVRAEVDFLTSINMGTGTIDPGQEDDWGTLND
jgi:hypothetical protein